VLITGASTGIGREFARIFARHGHDLLLIANAARPLATLARDLSRDSAVKVDTLHVDLTDRASGEKIVRILDRNHLQVAILVNNAGIGNYGKFANVRWEKQKHLLDLNMGILTELCHRMIPHMLRHGGGKILNVASMASFAPGPYYATYYASKAYVLLLTEALREEYRKENLVISAVCPGPSPTNFFKKAPMTDSSWLLRRFMVPPARIAEQGYGGLMRGKGIIIPGLIFNLIPWGGRLLPRRWLTRISRIMVEIAARG
jgi:hypothetical protein